MSRRAWLVVGVVLLIGLGVQSISCGRTFSTVFEVAQYFPLPETGFEELDSWVVEDVATSVSQSDPRELYRATGRFVGDDERAALRQELNAFGHLPAYSISVSDVETDSPSAASFRVSLTTAGAYSVTESLLTFEKRADGRWYLATVHRQ